MLGLERGDGEGEVEDELFLWLYWEEELFLEWGCFFLGGDLRFFCLGECLAGLDGPALALGFGSEA